MNRIIPCFDEHSSQVNSQYLTQLSATNEGVFVGRRATFNNNPLLLSDSETAAFAPKVNIAALMRRIYVGIVVNNAPVSDIPTHVLVVANGEQEDAIDIDEGELESIVSEFVAKDFPLPEVVFISADDENLSTKIEKLLAVEVVSEVVVEETPVVEELIVQPAAEEVVQEAPAVEEKPTKKKKK